MSRVRQSSNLDGLFLAIGICLVFMVLSYVSILGDANSALLGGGLLNVVLSQPIWATQLGAELAQFVGALVLSHLFLAVLSFGLARLTLIAWPESQSSQRALAVFWLVMLVIWVMAANAAWFPRTALGAPYDHMANFRIAGVSVFQMLTAALSLSIAAVVVVACARRSGAILRSKVVWVGGVVALAAGTALPAMSVFGTAAESAGNTRPHVILIGIDSLRTDFVQSDEQQWTPRIDEFMNRSIQFSDAITPLARTFPAWVSILSGRHPHTTGAFVNLLPRELIDEGETIPSILGANGYETIYAIDEVRFSNLDATYGFKKVLAPPMGSADFMLGFFADTPLANILANTRVGEWLYPYAYANRAASKTYEPDTFIDRIDDGVAFADPTFLAVHFTLTHWPYVWASAPAARNPDGSRMLPADLPRGKYEIAVDRVDQQFGKLMDLLDKKGALKNAIVVVLSDHGESLGEASVIAERDYVVDRLLRAASLSGHGTHVFSRNQYNVVLGLNSYGNDLLPNANARVLGMPVSLEDLAPTVLDILDLDQGQSFDGRSLLPYLRNDESIATSAEERVRFLETEFNPAGISPELMLTASAITTAADKYSVNPHTDRILVREEFVDEMLAMRQYAAELDGRILATIPASDYRTQHILYYDPNLDQLRWLDEPPVAADGRELYKLWNALEQRFVQVRTRPVVPPPSWDDELQ